MLPSKERGVTFEVFFFGQLQLLTNRIHGTENTDQIMLEVSGDICKLFNADRPTLYAVNDDRTAIVSKVNIGLNSTQGLKLPISVLSIAIRLRMQKASDNQRKNATGHHGLVADGVLGQAELTTCIRKAREKVETALESAVSDNELVKSVNRVIIDDHHQKVSDSHVVLIPGKARTGIRFRIDGTLRPYIEVPAQVHQAAG